LFDYLWFYAPLKNISLLWRRHHCRWRAAKFWPMLGAQGLWAGRDLYRATPAETAPMYCCTYVQFIVTSYYNVVNNNKCRIKWYWWENRDFFKEGKSSDVNRFFKYGDLGLGTKMFEYKDLRDQHEMLHC
jgi:hypothetical protein